MSGNSGETIRIKIGALEYFSIKELCDSIGIPYELMEVLHELEEPCYIDGKYYEHLKIYIQNTQGSLLSYKKLRVAELYEKYGSNSNSKIENICHYFGLTVDDYEYELKKCGSIKKALLLLD